MMRAWHDARPPHTRGSVGPDPWHAGHLQTLQGALTEPPVVANSAVASKMVHSSTFNLLGSESCVTGV
jgi:hypothetical protein